MMIGKNGLAANGNPPIPEIAEERIRIAETAERKKWAGADFVGGEQGDLSAKPAKDRKSTRLNSSHLVISYAVFCLKQKKHRYSVSLEAHVTAKIMGHKTCYVTTPKIHSAHPPCLQHVCLDATP